MSVITLTATLPSEFVSTASVGTSADWLVIQKSGESFLSRIAATPSACGAAALAGSSSQNFACKTLTVAENIVIPNTSTIWNASYSSGINFATDNSVTFYASEFKCWNAGGGNWAPITGASLYCVTGGVLVNGSITAEDRASYDLGSPAGAFNELYLAADGSSMGRYNHTAIYTSADGFKIRTASGSGSSWSFSDTLKPLFSSDSGHTSNRRLKREIVPLAGARALVGSTMPTRFNMKTDKTGDRVRLGFIAEELEAVFPEAVMPIGETFEEDGAQVKAVLLMPLLAAAIQAIRELDEALEIMTARVDALESA